MTITAVPDIGLSTTTLALHAPNEMGTVTITNPALVTISDITESSGGNVLNIGSYNSGVLSVYASGTGASRIIVHDELLDQNESIAVSVDDAFFEALPQTAIGAVAGGSAVS